MAEQKSFERVQMRLSPSVRATLDAFPPNEPVPAWELVRTLLRKHGEYAAGRGGKWARRAGPQASTAYEPYEWAEKTARLFDSRHVLHGRLFILGLAQSDPVLAAYLHREGFLHAVAKEIEEPLEDLWSTGEDVGRQTDRAPDQASFHTDGPSVVDQLGRGGFATALATWLSRYWRENKDQPGHSFRLQLHGPWGSGKTTLLKLLEGVLHPKRKAAATQVIAGAASLAQIQPWIVVWHNAWRLQHIDPAWWSFLDNIYRQGVEQLKSDFDEPKKARRLRWWEQWWRFQTANGHYLVALLTSLFVGGLVLATSPTGTLATVSKALLAVGSLLGMIWSGTLFLMGSLVTGSADSARELVGRAPDPMKTVHAHFKHLIDRFDKPVLVFVDDLDRCQPKYAVELLESIQTLFNYHKIYYVVAADRKWLYHSFETCYEKLAPNISEPGRGMGYLFLEKIFQLSTAVPPMTEEVRQAYLDHLVTKQSTPLTVVEDHQAAIDTFQKANTESALIDALKPYSGGAYRDQVYRSAAIVRSASQQLQKSTEYFLRPFAPLLERNPRAIKRLLNGYGIQRAIAIQTDLNVVLDENRRKQLALWTILSMRWPSLAEYLERDPGKLEPFKTGKSNPNIEIENEMTGLIGDDALMDVINGNTAGVGVSLNVVSLQSLVGLEAGAMPPGSRS